MNKPRLRDWFIWAYWPCMFAFAVLVAWLILGLADRMVP
jgi:hypothetical protein